MSKSILIATLLLSLAAAYVGNRFGGIASRGAEAADGIALASDLLASEIAAEPFALSDDPVALGGALAGFLATWCLWAAFLAMPRNLRAGEEHGSARWGTPREGAAFMDRRNPDNNVILTERYGMALRRKRFDLRLDRNLNFLVVGGSGSGKSRFVVKPNLMQLNANYFLTDPKGTALLETGHMFEAAGYDIKSFNTIQFDRSLRYNPLQYVRTDADILSFVNCLVANTNGRKEGSASSDPFWENSEKLLYIALIAFLRDWMDEADYTLPGLLYLLSLARAKEDDEDYESPLDLMFKQIETGLRYSPAGGGRAQEPYDEAARGLRPESGAEAWEWGPSAFVNKRTGVRPADVGGLAAKDDFALSNYKAFKTAAGKTMKSIIISCNVRLKPLEIAELSRLLEGAPDENGDATGRCELELDKLGDPGTRTAVFAILSDTDRAFSFLFAILMWQTVNVLCDRALGDYGGRLPRFVHFMFDEFANIGTLPGFDRTIAVTRSRNIGVTIVLQSLSQLKARYGEDEAKVIADCCDTMLFLGGKSPDTNKEVSEGIGQQTIGQITFNQSRGATASYTKNYQTQGRALIDPAEVALLPRDEALLLIAGARPLRDRKYPVERHPRYAEVDPGHRPVRKGLRRIPPVHAEPFDYAGYVARTRRRRE